MSTFCSSCPKQKRLFFLTKSFCFFLTPLTSLTLFIVLEQLPIDVQTLTLNWKQFNPTGISARHIGEDRDPSLVHPSPSLRLYISVTFVEFYCPLLAVLWKCFHCIDVSFGTLLKVFLFVSATHSLPVICVTATLFEYGHWLLACSHTCDCLLDPEALTCCSQKFPFPWEEDTHPQTPTRHPAETSPLMTTTPQCCPNVPYWLCKRTRLRRARRSFTKDQSSIRWWATCHLWSQGRVLLDQGLAKVTVAKWVLAKSVTLTACGMWP